MHEWCNISTANFRRQDCLLHREKRGCESTDPQSGQLAAGLEALPSGDHLDAKSRNVEIGP
jgi:hypothetical protein